MVGFEVGVYGCLTTLICLFDALVRFVFWAVIGGMAFHINVIAKC